MGEPGNQDEPLPDGLSQDLEEMLSTNDDHDVLTERLVEYEKQPRDEKIIDEIAPHDYLGEYDPGADEQLHRFIALREAGFGVGVDICNHYETWFELTARFDVRNLGFKLILRREGYFDESTLPETIEDLNRSEDWTRLKELAEFDADEYPMEMLGDVIEGVHDANT